MIGVVTYLLVFLAAISAVSIIILKEVFHAALALIFCLLCVAGIFVTFNAEFLAVVQILVYAGGVLLLIIFGIMLTRSSSHHLLTSSSLHLVISSIVGLALFSGFIYAIGNREIVGYPQVLSPEIIGTELITTYLLEFEVAGVLLLISLIGAIVAATNLKKSQ